MSSDLIGSVTGETEFLIADHLISLREERREEKKRQDDSNEAKLKGLVKDLKSTDLRLILRAKTTGSLLIVWGTTVTVTVLAAKESRDFLCTCYDVTPSNPKNNVTASPSNSPYATDLSSAMEASLSHITKSE